MSKHKSKYYYDSFPRLLLLLCISAAIALKDVRLNSTLIRGHLALPQQQVVFTCVARNSTILEWQSNEHIGTDGDNILILSVGSRDNVTSATIPTTYATQVSVTIENGITVIVSRLFITTSERFPTSSVTCRIYGRGSTKTIPFNTTGMANTLLNTCSYSFINIEHLFLEFSMIPTVSEFSDLFG